MTAKPEPSQVGPKRCTRCHAELPASSFYRSGRSTGGLHPMCKECCRAKNKEWRAAHPERTRERKRQWRRRNPGANEQHRKRWDEANGAKRHAHREVERERRAGRLAAPEHCERCGSPCRLVAHHDDYAKPLDVRWLCYRCHQTVHTRDGDVVVGLEDQTHESPQPR